MALKTLFFFDDRSSYSRAHFAPVLECFDVIGTVVPTDARISTFKTALLGASPYVSPRPAAPSGHVRRLARRVVPASIKRVLKDLSTAKSPDLEALLRHQGIERLRVFDVNAESSLERFAQLSPDLIICAAYPQVFSSALLSLPAKGCVNFHPSLLPKYRGAHPHFWAIARGESRSGITAHFMTEGVDEGDIIAQVGCDIREMTYSGLYAWMITETPGLVRSVKAFLEDEMAVARPQGAEHATYFRSDKEIHRRIFFAFHDATDIHNLVRTERSFCFFRGRQVQFTKTCVTASNRNLTNDVRVEPGTIIDVSENYLTIKAKAGCINIMEFGCGSKRISFLQWAEKQKIRVGEKFT